MTPLPRLVIGWEAVLPAGLWIMGGKLMLRAARLGMRAHIAPRQVTFRLTKVVGPTVAHRIRRVADEARQMAVNPTIFAFHFPPRKMSDLSLS